MLGGMTDRFHGACRRSLPWLRVIAVSPRRPAVGLALHRFAIEPARGASPVVLIMITIGASVLLRGVAQIVFDKRFHSLPPLFGADAIQFGGAAILPQSLVVLTGAGSSSFCFGCLASNAPCRQGGDRNRGQSIGGAT